MPKPVSLSNLLHDLESDRPRLYVIFHKRTGNIMVVDSTLRSFAPKGRSEAHRPKGLIFNGVPELKPSNEDRARARENCVFLNIPMRPIVEQFCRTLKDSAARDGLLERLQTHGDVDTFLDGLYRYKVANEWFRFRGKAIEEIVIRWLEENEIPYLNDLA